MRMSVVCYLFVMMLAKGCCLFVMRFSGAWPFHYEYGNIAHFRHHLNFHSLFFCFHTNVFCCT